MILSWKCALVLQVFTVKFLRSWSDTRKICDVTVKVRRDSLGTPLSSTSDLAPNIAVLELNFSDEEIWVGIPGSEPFGCIGNQIAKTLIRLKNSPGLCVKFDANVQYSRLGQAQSSWRKSDKSVNLMIEINLHGHSHSSSTLGRILSNSKIFLQPPDIGLGDVTYENPQEYKIPEDLQLELANAEEQQNLPAQPLIAEASLLDIDSIMDHIPQPTFLQEASVDSRIITTLAKHQKEALNFMERREMGDLPPSLSLWRGKVSQTGLLFYENIITVTKSSTVDDPKCGILADDMGLGKTLSILALIVSSLHRALDFAIQRTSGASHAWINVVPSKATLVVVPSALLLDSWTEEISKHVMAGTMKIYRYHGERKQVDLQELLACDIVLTTYATIAAGFCRGQSILSRIEWFRVVLDEAHYIRNPDTKQFRAISTLPAYIRWCLTGTPIQNTLEDLGALVKFLRVPILDDTKVFRKHVITPVSSGHFTNMQRLLEALCLRRTKDLLNLPDSNNRYETLELSEIEYKVYRDYGESCRRAIDVAISGHSIKKANHHVIQAVLGMRLFCNEGSIALQKRWSMQGLPADPIEALSYMQTNGQSDCALCSCEIQSIYQIDDHTSGVLTNCQHLVCGECLPDYETDLDNNLEDERSQCPLCERSGPRDSFIMKFAPGSTNAPRTSYPTKLIGLLHNIKNQLAMGKWSVKTPTIDI